MNAYGFRSKDYLARTRECLEKEDRQYLFYAALELRCCVERRQQEYIEAQRRFLKLHKPHWQMGKRQKALSELFAEKVVAKMDITLASGESITAYHIPIPRRVVKSAERMGDFLHATKESHDPDDKWWEDLRKLVTDVYRGIWVPCQGNLMCPPIVDRDGNMNVPIAFDNEEAAESFLQKSLADKYHIVKAEYLSSPPDIWPCNI